MPSLRMYLLWNDFPLRFIQADHPASPISTREHSHTDFFELVVVKSGKATHQLEGRNMPINAGDVFLVHPGLRHSYLVAKNLCIYNILFSKALLRHFQHELTGLPNYQLLFNLHRNPADIGPRLEIMHMDKQHFPILIEALTDAVDEEVRGEPASKVAIISDFLRTMLLICRHCDPGLNSPEGTHAFQIGKLMATLEKTYAENWTLERMSTHLNMSQSLFRQQFKELTGQSPICYLLKLRLRKASFMLISDNSSISDIAFRCGFADSNYFTRQFRSEFGVSPREYRQQGN